MEKMIFIDTETTGLDYQKSGIWQLAGIIECGGKIKTRFNYLMDIFDDNEIDPRAAEMNGITEAKLSSYRSPLLVFQEFRELLGKYVDPYDKKDKFVAVGYGAEFDNQMLRSWWERNGDTYFGSWFHHPWICVMNLAMYVYKKQRSEFSNFKLGTVLQRAGIQPKGDLHDAATDIEATYELYKTLEVWIKEQVPF